MDPSQQLQWDTRNFLKVTFSVSFKCVCVAGWACELGQESGFFFFLSII